MRHWIVTPILALSISTLSFGADAAKPVATKPAVVPAPTAKTTGHSAKNHGHKNHGAHVHGEAELRIVLNKNEAVVELESPAENIYGFEHAPKDAKQKQHVEAMNLKLTEYATKLITFTPDPACVPKVQIEKPFGENHAHHDEHSEVEIELKFKCPKDLESLALSVNVRKYFPGIKRLKTQFITSKKQTTATITTESHKFAQ